LEQQLPVGQDLLILEEVLEDAPQSAGNPLDE
jgi:hypothetical protein